MNTMSLRGLQWRVQKCIGVSEVNKCWKNTIKVLEKNSVCFSFFFFGGGGGGFECLKAL